MSRMVGVFQSFPVISVTGFLFAFASRIENSSDAIPVSMATQQQHDYTELPLEAEVQPSLMSVFA